jgi:hypothetical protein
MRGPVGATVPAGSPLALQPDLTGLPEASYYRLEMVDAVGNPVWSGTTKQTGAPALKAGEYYVRVYSPEGKLLREYGLQAQPR